MATSDIFTQKEQEIIFMIDRMFLPKNPAVVFDIDSTLVDIDQRPITPIIRAYNYIQKKGIPIFVVTARPGTEENIKITVEQLNSMGVSTDMLYFLPEGKEDLARFKTLARRHIVEKRGYNIVMSVGDSWWDIMGENVGLGVFIPKIVEKVCGAPIISDYVNP